MPVDAARRIRTARLRGGSESLIRRGALLLEDALRTASLRGTVDERLVLIRSISLGVLRSDKSAARVARQLDAQVADLARHAVHGDDPRASDAPAVYFHDRLDAVVTLIRHLSQGDAGTVRRAWYWRLAVPGWQPESTPLQAGRLLLGDLLNLGIGSQALAQAFQRLIVTHSLDVILQAVRAQDGVVLLQRCGWRDSDPGADSTPAPSVATAFLPIPRAWHPVLSQWIARWGPSDARSLWLVALAVQSWRPDGARISGARNEAKAFLRTMAALIDAPIAWDHPDGHSLGRLQGNAGLVAPVVEPTVREAPQQQAEVPLYTPYAGFLFLIPLLARAGLSRAIQGHPEWIDSHVPWRVLRSIAERLSIPEDDPVYLWLSASERGSSEQVQQEHSECVAKEVEAIVAQWRQAMRSWCRLQAHLGLANLVHRPGWVSCSQTHVEVWMPLSDIDLRIRRAGLDIDPGWVPWLGQVIRFHYDPEGRPHGTGRIAGH